jgi:hypothetical protein
MALLCRPTATMWTVAVSAHTTGIRPVLRQAKEILHQMPIQLEVAELAECAPAPELHRCQAVMEGRMRLTAAAHSFGE